MEQPVLAPARAVIRRLAALLAIASLAWAGARVVDATVTPARAPLVVEVAADLPEEVVAAQVDEAVALAEARALGWVRTDPVIVRRLVANLRFLGEAGTDVTLLDAAIALGMDLTDPVVRARLLDRVGRELARPPAPADDDTLAAHLRDHAATFRRPHVLRVSWRVLDAGVDAGAALATLRAGGDVTTRPLLDLRDGEPTTVTRVRGRLGDAVADGLDGAPSGEWRGPFTTPLGTTVLLRVDERRPGVLPPLAEVRAAVEASWRAAGAPAWMASRRVALRTAWAPVVVRR